MKRKGFTLIELLAVIVILAIIALISVPAVLNIIEDSRKGAAEASARNIISAAKTYHMQQSMKGSSIDNINLEEDILKYDGNQASKGYIVFDANGKTTSKMYINGYCVEILENGKITSEKVEEDECVVETEELKGTAYALVLDNSTNEEDNLPLIFVRSETEIKTGDTYNSDRYGKLKVLGAYTGFENEVYEREIFYPFENNVMNYVYLLQTPWANHSPYITSVVAEDKVRFASLDSLFESYLNLSYADVGNIDISKNNSLNSLFAAVGLSIDNHKYHISGCFGNDDCWIGGASVDIIGLENWNTSNITDMSYMFSEAFISSMGDISSWKTSNVKSMAGMFLETYGTFELKISNWDTRNVEDMSAMFLSGGLSGVNVDLRNWNVDKVTEWSAFNSGNEDNILAPAKFQTTEE